LTIPLFVYGTLAPGSDAWPVLAQWATGTPCADRVAGILYDTGRGYPAAVFADAGFGDDDAAISEGTVHGYVVELDPARATEALTALDCYEGSEYARVTVRTAGGVEVATYAWIAPLNGCRPVADGRWDQE
jgi:gamma-glutamylcyclotransferase (GGCT)/AIG2-like uncharacterized protein YtfP